MPAFRVSGSTGQAPTTSFFGPVPDKFNMLLPGHVTPSGAGPGDFLDNQIAANFIKDWTIYNPTFWGGANTASCSFTAGQSAPDGTTAASKMVESTLNDFHFVTAGWKQGGALVGNFPRAAAVFRTAVFAKAAERTRFALVFGAQGNTRSGTYQNLTQGVRVIFDLAGGQIGQAAANFGSPSTPWNVVATGIIAFGSGWYLCYFDSTIGSHQGFGNAVYAGVVIDANSGTAAENTTYTGDGTSGILVWRATQLPAQAWGMSMQPVFLDDFNDNTMAEFDVNNTKAPGFKWYYEGQWPGKGYNVRSLSPIPSNFFTVSGSAITLPPITSAGYDYYLLSPAVWLGGSTYLGQLFTAPMIVEEKVKWSAAFNTQFPGITGGNFQTDINTLLVQGNNSPLNGAPQLTWSAVETVVGFSPLSETTMFIGPTDNTGNPPEWMQNPSFLGYGLWYNAIGYGGGAIVWDPVDLNLYKATGSPTIGLAPHSDLGNWALYDPSTASAIELPPPNKSILIDFTVYHTYQTIWLPTDPVYGPAHTLTFFDGVFATYVGSYTRQEPPFWAEKLPGNLFLLGSTNYGHVCDRMAIYN